MLPSLTSIVALNFDGNASKPVSLFLPMVWVVLFKISLVLLTSKLVLVMCPGVCWSWPKVFRPKGVIPVKLDSESEFLFEAMV